MTRPRWSDQPLVVETVVVGGARYRVEHLDDGRAPYWQTRFWARGDLEPFTPEHEMTARRLVRPDQFLDTLFWGSETTAALILERGLRIQTVCSAGPATSRPAPPEPGLASE